MRIAAEAREVGGETLVKLGQQSEQLTGMHRNMDEVQANLDFSERTLRYTRLSWPALQHFSDSNTAVAWSHYGEALRICLAVGAWLVLGHWVVDCFNASGSEPKKKAAPPPAPAPAPTARRVSAADC